MSIQELVSNPTVKRFDLRVLSWLCGIDEMQNYAAIDAPLKHLSASKLASILEAHRRGKAPLVDNVVHSTNDRCTRKKVIDSEGKAQLNDDSVIIEHHIESNI